ncbi:MAG: hypothetical protein JSS96_16735, partial [Bacteroidetes bacterium]|nr:hypothetical protein [Bacteroidota bacterium]
SSFTFTGIPLNLTSWTAGTIVTTVCSKDGDAYRYGFNGKLKDNEWSGIGNHVDYGERALDTRTGRWQAVDPLFRKYAYFSPYSYVANSPLAITDRKGEDLHVLFYTTGGSKTDDAMFRAAALTRKYDVEHSASFDPKKDKVVVIGISDMSDVMRRTHQAVQKLSPRYGKTTEFGIWSHASLDGPVGSTATSEYRLDNGLGYTQMSKEGWQHINFNWGKNAIAGFYGCRTGVGGNESFGSKISGLSNFKDVKVLGQSNYSYPSSYTDFKDNGGRNSATDFSLIKPNFISIGKPSNMDNFSGPIIWVQDGDKVDKTYMISAPKHSSGDVAQPMTVSENGQQIGTTTQQGNTMQQGTTTQGK